jgi:hypothetical protein
MPDPTPSAFTTEQRAMLACVLDLLIPPSRDGRLPGAGEAGVGARVDAVAQRDAGFQQLVATGLAALDEHARAAGAAAFADLAPEARLAALHAIAAAHAAFVPALLFHTYAGYYMEPRVVAALGVASHPPFPKGFALAPFDEALLARVKKREKLYRDA